MNGIKIVKEIPQRGKDMESELLKNLQAERKGRLLELDAKALGYKDSKSLYTQLYIWIKSDHG